MIELCANVIQYTGIESIASPSNILNFICVRSGFVFFSSCFHVFSSEKHTIYIEFMLILLPFRSFASFHFLSVSINL